jgi:hypothetical protein
LTVRLNELKKIFEVDETPLETALQRLGFTAGRSGPDDAIKSSLDDKTRKFSKDHLLKIARPALDKDKIIQALGASSPAEASAKLETVRRAARSASIAYRSEIRKQESAEPFKKFAQLSKVSSAGLGSFAAWEAFWKDNQPVQVADPNITTLAQSHLNDQLFYNDIFNDLIAFKSPSQPTEFAEERADNLINSTTQKYGTAADDAAKDKIVELSALTADSLLLIFHRLRENAEQCQRLVTA